MTDRFVYTRAVDALADMEHREVVAQLALDAVRAEKKRLIDFLDLYEHFEARGEDQAGARGEEPEASAASANEADAVDDTASADQSTAARKDVPESDELAGPVHNQDGGSLAPQNDRAGGSVESGLASKVVAGVESVTVGRVTQPEASPRSNGSQAGTQAPPVDIPEPGSEGLGVPGREATMHSPAPDAPIPPATVAQTVPAHEPVAASSPAGSDAVAIPATNPPEEANETTGMDRGAGESPASQEATGKSAGPSGSAAPTLKELIRPVYLAHPDWTGNQIADHIERPRSSVKAVLVTVRRELREAAQSPQETEERPEATDAPEAGPDAPPTSPEPVAAIQPRPLFTRPIFEVGDDGEDDVETSFPVPKPKPLNPSSSDNPLREKVRTMVRFHPNWTARMIAQRIGAPLPSILSYFDEARAGLVEEPAQPVPAARA